ncbi:hypothetical protein D3C75_1137400 [compost metagenome]
MLHGTGDAVDLRTDLFGHRRLLLRRRRHLLAHVTDTLHRHADTLQRLLCLQHPRHTVLRFIDAQTGNAHGLVGTGAQTLDDALDLYGRLPGLAG